MTEPRRSVSLRRKLAGLLAAFAVFAVVAAAATIYGLQWHLQDALEDFERTLGQTAQIDHLEVALREHVLLLHDVVDGHTGTVQPLFAKRDEFLNLLRQVATFTHPEMEELNWTRLVSLAQELANESDHCLDLVRQGDRPGAKVVLQSRLQGELVPALASGLRDARASLDAMRSHTSRALGTTTSQVLLLTVSVGVLAGGLAILGVMLMRRWLFQPIVELQDVTEHFRRGDLDYRAQPRRNDELAALGVAMNEMAQSLAAAQAKLKASETKHRLLFNNLRDAVVICDSRGCVVEYHDSDARLLGVDGTDPIGRHFAEVWPEWKAFGDDFSAVLEAAAVEGRRHRAVDVELTPEQPGAPGVWVDVLVYRIEYGGARYAAVVVRDVTQRQRLQRKVRQAETMEAVGTLAGGLAHDFNNLLAGVIGSLSMLATETSDAQHADRLRSAVQTCWQAASLSRRLLNFAGSAHGEPQVFRLDEAVTVIMESLDPSFLEGVDVDRVVDDQVFVRMDRDQFTQIVLNLIRNARDAMPEGGRLSVRVGFRTARDPEDARRERQYATVIVQDAGTGMSREVQRRVFEPFFTTKSRSSRRGRGMGLAIVYSAVRNADGFVQIDSEPNEGTTFTVFLPIQEGSADLLDAHESAKPTKAPPLPPARDGIVFLVEEDDVIRDVSTKAIQRRGYVVTAADGVEDARTQAKTIPSGNMAVALIDLDLSDGDSLELAEALVRIHPGARLLFTTADRKRHVPEHLEPYVHAQVEKPFTLEALADAVAEAFAPSKSPPL